LILGRLSEHRTVSYRDCIEGVQRHPLRLGQRPFISAQLGGPHEVGDESHRNAEYVALPSRRLVKSEERGAFLAQDVLSGPVSDLENTSDEYGVHKPEAAEP